MAWEIPDPGGENTIVWWAHSSSGVLTTPGPQGICSRRAEGSVDTPEPPLACVAAAAVLIRTRSIILEPIRSSGEVLLLIEAIVEMHLTLIKQVGDSRPVQGTEHLVLNTAAQMEEVPSQRSFRQRSGGSGCGGWTYRRRVGGAKIGRPDLLNCRKEKWGSRCRARGFRCRPLGLARTTKHPTWRAEGPPTAPAISSDTRPTILRLV